jgi:asparagine synthase (glutamine-hydrolysing)
MPGITGVLTHDNRPNTDNVVPRMVKSMLHESHYTSGYLSGVLLGCHIGWVNHGGSYSDCMPIWNERRDIALIFTGEHFADPSESINLRASGHSFTDADASCLVHLYEELGIDFVKVLNGCFSGVVIDNLKQQVFLFNDRFGLGRLYLHESKNGIYFSSEAKAILSVLPELRRLDMSGLGEMLSCGCTLENRTLFHGINLLPPASIWTFSRHQPLKKERYFDFGSLEHQTRLSPEDYLSSLKDCFTRILPRYLVGAQPVALSLTGGLDSRMILAGSSANNRQMRCYTFGGTYRDSEDVRVGRIVADLCRQPYSVITVDERFFPRFSELAMKSVYLSDGTMDVSGAVGIYVNRLARAIAPIRLTGNYGSEILRENIPFRSGRISTSPFSSDFVPFIAKSQKTYAVARTDCSNLSFITTKQMPWYHYGRLSQEQSQLTIRSPYLDNDLVPLAYRMPIGHLVNKQLAYRYTTDVQPLLAGAPTDRGQIRIPRLVPSKLVELSMELRPRAEYYFDYGMPQWLAKVDRALSRIHLERLFLGQQKYYHFRIWYRHQLSGFVREYLLDPKTLSRPYLNRREVERIVQAHVSGNGNYTTEIHKLMTIEMIQRSLIEGK